MLQQRIIVGGGVTTRPVPARMGTLVFQDLVKFDLAAKFAERGIELGLLLA